MANACAKCGGTGYGYIDPEIGHRGTDPCPECEAKLVERVEAGEFDTVVRGKTVKAKEPPPLGRPVKLAPAPKKTVDFIDGAPRTGAEEEEGMTVDEAVEQGIFTQAEVDASNAAELEALGVTGAEAGEE